MSDHTRFDSDDFNDSDDFAFDHITRKFDPMARDRKARRKRKAKVKHVAKKTEQQIIAETVDDTRGLEGGFKTTYHPALFESGWLLESLRTFYDQQVITDILSVVKGGKEASVYRCAAHPSTGQTLLAAKVYRPRMFRNLRNDAMYREGRMVLGDEGKEVRATNHRVMRAIGKKTGYGMQVSHTSWLMYEYRTLQTLYAAGAAVPKVYASGENALIMTFCGDERLAAPTLSEAMPSRREAGNLFNEVIRNIEIMLANGLIHGDLSAYNILYWQGQITLIDFPQVINPFANRNAHNVLKRDIARVCEYFTKLGVHRDPGALTAQLWSRYVRTAPGQLERDDELPDQLADDDDDYDDYGDD